MNENHALSNEGRDQVRCRTCGCCWEEHDPDPDRAPCMRHGIVPLQAMVRKFRDHMENERIAADARTKALKDEIARCGGDPRGYIEGDFRIPRPEAGGKVLGVDFKEAWLPTPDDAGFYRYPDGSFIRPMEGYPGFWWAGGAGGRPILDPPTFRSVSEAARHLLDRGEGPGQGGVFHMKPQDKVAPYLQEKTGDETFKESP